MTTRPGLQDCEIPASPFSKRPPQMLPPQATAKATCSSSMVLPTPPGPASMPTVPANRLGSTWSCGGGLGDKVWCLGYDLAAPTSRQVCKGVEKSFLGSLPVINSHELRPTATSRDGCWHLTPSADTCSPKFQISIEKSGAY